MERVAIVGSRDWPDVEAVRRYVDSLPKETIIVSGGAPGVDTIAADAAEARGLPVVVFRADWDRHGKAAGFLRNRQIVDYAHRVVAFRHKMSRGTGHTIQLARAAGKPCRVFDTPFAL